MKICAMCGTKILNSMIPFKIMIPTTGMKVDPIDSCGRCFMLTRINDELQKSNRSKVDLGGKVQVGDPR